MQLKSESNIENNGNDKLILLLKENLLQTIYDHSSGINSIDWLEHREALLLLSPIEMKITIEVMIECCFGNINIPLRRKSIEKSLKEFMDCYQKIQNKPNNNKIEIGVGEELLSIIETVRGQHSETFEKEA